MSNFMNNESYSVGIMEHEALSKYILGLEINSEKNKIYMRYLKNLNYSSSNVSSMIQSFAKMLFSDNTSIYDQNETKSPNSDDTSPKQVSNRFDVANSEFILIMLTVIYVTIFVIGVLGNVVTCIVIARNKGMHTAVNYYLFSLAVSDLLLLISGEFTVCQILIFGRKKDLTHTLIYHIRIEKINIANFDA